MPERFGRGVLWLMFAWLALESVVTGASAIYWAAERDLGAAVISVAVSVFCGFLAQGFWRGLGCPSFVRR